MFPSVLEFADGPELAEVIARLEADHRELSGHVDEVERALGALAAERAADLIRGNIPLAPARPAHQPVRSAAAR
jgi:hypothetical protein